MHRLVIVIVLFILLAFPIKLIAADKDFRTDYTVDYYPQNQGNTISTKVTFSTKITNLQDQYYFDSYQLSYPSGFNIHDISASDDKGTIQPDVKRDSNNILIKVKLNDPKNGTGAVNTLTLQFTQDNLFTVNGNIWEVILPTLPGRGQGSYAIRVHMPSSDKRISIAKPKPSHVENNVIYWDNPTNKTVYAVFGDRQFYSLDLTYHLQNDQLIPVYTEIAFPPDTLYQKIIEDSVIPAPTSIRVDDDGNYIARYDLQPKQVQDVRFRGYAEIFAQPREEMKPVIAQQFEKQKGYLLKSAKYWTVSDPSAYSHLTSPDSIFQSVAGSLSYDYNRVNTKNYRLGADVVLKNPSKAVCVEFTDSFIALARINNIYAREIEGFGFSQDEKLRPLSLITDVLHSWPEYYDTETNLWNQVDPTWQNTSGIDYFSSFDLEHIAFAIHGKSSEDPAPAGTYKIKDSRDVTVQPVTALPEEKTTISVSKLKLSAIVSDKHSYNGSVEVTNSGNVTAYNVPVTIESNDFAISPGSKTILQLPPHGTYSIDFTYILKPGLHKSEAAVTAKAGDSSQVTQSVRVNPFTQTVTVGVSATVAIFLFLLLIFLIHHRKK